MRIEMKFRQPNEMLVDQMLVKHMAGSRAYGTNLPTSDVDIRGVFVADELYYKSPWFTVEEINIDDEEDTKYYELSKFLKLLVDQNPNIVETLWVDDEDVLESSPAYELLRANREKLLSSKTAFTFSGYAVAQLKRIKGHNKWINNPQPEAQPRMIDFVTMVQSFAEGKELKFDFNDPAHLNYVMVHYGQDLYGMYENPEGKSYKAYDVTGALIANRDIETHTLGNPVRLIRFNRDEYKLAKEKHNQYWTWKKNRNESRSELEAKFGYDTKHAMHLVRLLRMGKEILTEGVVRVKRPDAKELLEIRDGKWTYEELVAYAEQLDSDIRKVHYKETTLQKKVDVKFATQLMFDAMELSWSGK